MFILAHKCDDWTEEYLVWKQEIVRKPEVIYVSYMFILGLDRVDFLCHFQRYMELNKT